MWRLLAVLLLVMSSSSVFAQSEDGSARRYLSGCRAILDQQAPKDLGEAADLGKCVGVVEATMKIAPLIERTGGFCIPSEATTTEGVALAVGYLTEHPDMLDEDFIALILAALDEKWPCPE